jgi:uncharacterized protein YbaP (TraB family)
MNSHLHLSPFPKGWGANSDLFGASLKLFRVCCFILILALANYACADSRIACPPVAEKPTPEMLQNAARNARDRGFLWRISKDGHTSYLYGTIHVGKFDWVFPGPSVMKAISETDTVALELDDLDADIQNRMVKEMTAMHSAALPEALVKRMRQQADSACVSYNSIARLSPELQITTLTLMVGRGEGLDASYAIDGVLAGIGHGARKNMVSLETPELQLQMLQMRNQQETISFVQDGLDELESGRSRSLLNRVSQVWANADYTEMSHFNEWCECLDSEIEREVMRRLLDERNPDLANRIDALHGSGKQVFAAVGSLHMFGPIGLPVLMEKRGFKVERVDFKMR